MSFQVFGLGLAGYDVATCLEKAWRVRFLCAGCDRGEVFWDEPELLARPPGATLGQIAAAAVCSACGSTVGEVALRQGHWGDRVEFARG
jgi:hypothetical protein